MKDSVNLASPTYSMRANFSSKVGAMALGARAGVNGNEVARRANPLGRDVGDVIELAAFERRLDVPGLESFLDQFSGLGVHFVLERARHSGLGGFGWVEPPCFSLLCHRYYSFWWLPFFFDPHFWRAA